MHCILQMELHSGRSASAAARRLCRFGREALLRVGLDPKRAPLLVALNLLRMLFLYGEARCVAQAKDGDRRYISLRSEERRVGKSVSVRVDLGGRRIINKKKKNRRCQPI